jgi:hypothetical protein
MMTRKGLSFATGRNAALVATAALTFVVFAPAAPANADALAPAAGITAASGTATDFSAARRHRHHRHYRHHGGNAAAAAAFAGIIGTVGAIAASQARRDYYYDRGYGYGYGGPVYYSRPYRPYRGYYNPGYGYGSWHGY